MNLEEKDIELEEEEEEVSIDLLEIIGALRSKLAWIVAASLFGAVLAYGISCFLITPLYQAQVIMYVNNRKSNTYAESISRTQITTAAELVPTYQEFVNIKPVMQRAIDEGGLTGYTPEDLLKMVSTQLIEDTGIFAITVTGAEQFDVAEIANAVARSSTSEITEHIEGATTTIIDYAVDPMQKSYPSNKRNALIGFLAGFVLSSAVVLAIYFLDTRIKKTEDFVKAMDAPVLGMIQSIQLKTPDADGKTQNDSKKSEKSGGKR